MKKEMLINVLQPEECRIAIVEDGVLEELYVERASQESYVGNIYKGRIVNIEPSIQAAFVDFGIGRNGFLHVSDVDPVYFKHLLPPEVREQLEAENNAEFAPQNEARRGRERTDRGESREQTRDLTRPGTAPESALTPAPATLPPARPAIPPVGYFEDEDAAEFGAGLDLNESQSPLNPPGGDGDSSQGTADVFETLTAAPPRPDTGTSAAELQNEAESPGKALSDFSQPTISTRPRHHPPSTQLPHPASLAHNDEDEEPFAVGLELEAEPEASTDFDANAAVTTLPSAGNSSAPAGEAAHHDFPQTQERAEHDIAPGIPQPDTADSRSESQEIVLREVESTPTESSGETSDLPPLHEESLSEDDKPIKPRSRSRTRKSRDATDDDEAASESEPKKPRSRRGRKKTEGETAEDANSSEAVAEDSPPADMQFPDAEPRIMGGPERRTSADDEEPEIQPFFEGSSDDFDIHGPNDRFSSGSTSEGSETTELSSTVIDRDDTTDEVEEATAAEAGLDDESDDDEFAPPRRSFDDVDGDDDDESGGRGRGRSRGRRRNGKDRPARSGPSSRDRIYPRPPIQEIFKRGQEVIVQVIKEGIGTKGPTLSTFISIAGRYLVLMPSLNRVGVSRKIVDPEARRRLRDIMNELNPPKGVGFIVRTAAVDRNESELQNDLAYLLRLWQVVVRRIKRLPAPVEIYRESDMITRTIRDIFTNDIDTIYVDEEHAFAHASEFLQIVMPRFASRIRFYADTEPLFHKYRIEEEIAKINQKRIDLPGGGSIIIEQTEALVAIDVNSGTFRADNNAEETAFQMNLRAAKEIARQLRLRDLGGVIVNDFIDMREEKHRRRVEDALREALKRDRARTKILRISQFGIIEMTRQRIQPSLKKRIFNECSHCNGTGYVKTQETMGIEVMRLLQLAAHRAPPVVQVAITVHVDAAFYLLNRKRKALADLEERSKIEVHVHGQYGVSPEYCDFKCFDANGNEVRLYGTPPMKMAGPLNRPRALPERRYPQPID